MKIKIQLMVMYYRLLNERTEIKKGTTAEDVFLNDDVCVCGGGAAHAVAANPSPS
jgi:hypothetical protein